MILINMTACQSDSSTSGDTQDLLTTTSNTIGSAHTDDVENESTILSKTEATETFEVVCLNAGKADAFVLKTKNHTIIIDTGVEDYGQKIVDYLKEQNITVVDYMIITHFDSDHVGGADKVIKEIEVKNVIQSDCPQTSEDYKEYIAALAKKNITPVTLRQDLTFILDDTQFTIYPPQNTTYADNQSNNSSLVTSVVHGINTFLFAGDSQSARLQELMKQGNLAHTFLKVPYHGFYQKNLTEFLNQVKPEYAVITSSDKLPESEVTVSALEALGTKIYYTKNGNITFLCDGKDIIVKQ